MRFLRLSGNWPLASAATSSLRIHMLSRPHLSRPGPPFALADHARGHVNNHRVGGNGIEVFVPIGAGGHVLRGRFCGLIVLDRCRQRGVILLVDVAPETLEQPLAARVESKHTVRHGLARHLAVQFALGVLAPFDFVVHGNRDEASGNEFHQLRIVVQLRTEAQHVGSATAERPAVRLPQEDRLAFLFSLLRRFHDRDVPGDRLPRLDPGRLQRVEDGRKVGVRQAVGVRRRRSFFFSWKPPGPRARCCPRQPQSTRPIGTCRRHGFDFSSCT